MPFVKTSPSDDPSPAVPSFIPPERPHFNSHITSDRLREGFGLLSPPFKMGGCIRKGRRSVFKEVGLDDDVAHFSPSTTSAASGKQRHVTFKALDKDKDFFEITGIDSEPRSRNLVKQEEGHEQERIARSPSPESRPQHRRRLSLPTKSWYHKLASKKSRPRVKSTSTAPPGTVSGLQRFAMLALLIAVVFPAFSWRHGQSTIEINGADAGAVTKRELSPTDVCKRWALQTAVLNGTVYMYGGRATTDRDQDSNTWNDYFLTLDLTADWDTESPSLTGLEIPDGPPNISMGYLWNDYNNLYLYGGQFSDDPFVEPGEESVWKYSIKEHQWTEFKNLKTSSGNYSENADIAVHRAAEGAGLSVPELGLSWYFGGHLDWSTTPGWSQDIDRVYLKSLLEFTHPGYVNSGVDKLSDGTGAGNEGAFRNITKGGIQAGRFPERADGALVFVPGWGDMGVLIGLAGGTADNFTDDLLTLDVYDIANSRWFHQETSGDAPSVRVNPCAVVASAPDASSFQIYVFGGQNLPFGNQTQYNDMYILTIPSFAWIKVDQSDQNVPSPRAGHSCAMHDGQMLIIGGYLGEDAACDDQSMYVFDASTLTWKTAFSAGNHDADWHPENFVLAGSYGYTVPEAVREVIGGNQEGSATATTPAAGVSDGPFATGTAPVFTITQSGATATITSGFKPTGSGHDDDDDDGSNSGVNPGLVAAGVIAGTAGLLAVYLGFCAWLYRRQVRAYKHHLAVTNRYSGASSNSTDPSFGRRGPWSSRESIFGWVGSERGAQASLVEPKWRPGDEFDDASPGTSGGASGGASSGPPNQSDDSRTYRGGSPSGGSMEGLLDGQEPTFFSVVMRPRRALRVVNGAE